MSNEVWVVYVEYSQGDPLADVLSVWTTEALAEAAQGRAIEEFKAEGLQVWQHEDEDDDEAHWDVSVYCKSFPVLTALPVARDPDEGPEISGVAG